MANAPTLPMDQHAIWNGPAGHAWVDFQALLDSMFRPIEDLLVEAVRLNRAANIVDIGCGTGATTLAIQQSIGLSGQCTGLDISAPMLAAARRRGEQEGSKARFLCQDIEQVPLEDTDFDMLVSRFGVMFFDDPVRAFARLQDSAAGGAKLLFAAWRSAAENPFMTTAERAAAAHLPHLPRRDLDGPGQFAFADPARVESILVGSGWRGVAIEPLDFECGFPVERLTDYISRLGPLGLILEQLEDEQRRRLVEAVREAFTPFVDGDRIRYTASCWTVRAHK